MEVIQGAHKFLVEVIRGTKESPNNKTFISMFGEFCSKPIKDYIFSRMGKKIMQELALCILQDLASNGPERAKTLQLEVEKASSGGKRVRIADQFAEDDKPIDQSFLEEIDEAIFKFKDQTGASPDVKVAAGQGLAAPYLPPSPGGAFVTPTKRTARSLTKEIEVSQRFNGRGKNKIQQTIGSLRHVPFLQAVAPANGGIVPRQNAWEGGGEVRTLA